MVNPRIVRGRRGAGVAFAVRGRVRHDVFVIGVPAEIGTAYPRLKVEARLLEEADSLMRQATQQGSFDWRSAGFRQHPDYDVWERTLTVGELVQLMES
jgi:hypothetical protein